MNRTFLMAVDSSDNSREAEKYARSLLDPTSDSIILLHVEDSSKKKELGQYTSHLSPKKICSLKRRTRKTMLKEKARNFKEQGFSVTTRTESGHPGNVICRLAEELDVDGIFIGRRGLGTVNEFLFGSVSHYVVHHADCPVNIVPTKSTA